MASTVELKGTVRQGTGKSVARKLRRENRVPGVLYGKSTDPVLLSLDAKEFIRALSAHSASNVIVDLELDTGGDVFKTVIREIQQDPLTGAPMHVDLNEISLTDEIEVDVPVMLEGVPSGVKNGGGMLQHSIRTVKLKCLPHNIPAQITVDVSDLEIGDSLQVSALNVPNVEILEESDKTLANVVPPKIEEVAAPEEEAEAAEAAEPEVVGKKKEDEGEESEG